jgi:RNA polymerase sigma-70 factor (ECF subfamily)
LGYLKVLLLTFNSSQVNSPINLNEKFHEVFSQYGDSLYYYVLKLTANEEKSKDIVQECFLRLWENIASIDTSTNLLPLLITYIKNLLIDDFRKEQKRKLFLTSLQQQQPGDLMQPEAEQQLALKDRQAQLSATLSGLSDKRQLIYRMVKQEGLTYKEVSRELSISIADVKKQMRLNLQVLRKVMQLLLTYWLLYAAILP